MAPCAVASDGALEAAAISSAVQISVTIRPSATDLPEDLATRIESIRGEVSDSLRVRVEDALAAGVTALLTERVNLDGEIGSLVATNADLIGKHKANVELSEVIEEHKKQVSALAAISDGEQARARLQESLADEAGKVAAALTTRRGAIQTLIDRFGTSPRTLDALVFGIEAEVPAESIDHVSKPFSQRSTNDYIRHRGDPVDYERAQIDPGPFLAAISGGRIALNRGYTARDAAVDVLGTTEDIRFTAELDGDRIGGFSRSSMTPGKQALFALTLILNESQEPWPLLIDQPEDDLDSRSIYDTIVPYLIERKRERQIIMVSHNANLVIGADAEVVVVANRHGVDRPDKDDRVFEYLSGSLKHTQALNKDSPTVLGRFGIREHACEILDGGEEAFQKRRQRYNI